MASERTIPTLRDLGEQVRCEIRRHRAKHPSQNLSWPVQIRRWYWCFIRLHQCEICGRCGRPVAHSCPSYWRADNALWREVIDPDGCGIRCILCFTADCKARGIHISWRAVREPEADRA